MGPPWWGVLALIFSGILAVLFIVGGFFEVRRFLRKLKPTDDANQESFKP
ncbi:MAG: hypothetical protein K6T83_05575 [Alicyclobacillus sp.]|nr:hypothetical protein [Alicyclobacillus sp.]